MTYEFPGAQFWVYGVLRQSKQRFVNETVIKPVSSAVKIKCSFQNVMRKLEILMWT